MSDEYKEYVDQYFDRDKYLAKLRLWVKLRQKIRKTGYSQTPFDQDYLPLLVKLDSMIQLGEDNKTVISVAERFILLCKKLEDNTLSEDERKNIEDEIPILLEQLSKHSKILNQ